jgi:hypothetical protein
MGSLFPGQAPPTAAVSSRVRGDVATEEDAAPAPFLLPCSTPQGEVVVNRGDEELGQLEHIVIDAPSGRIAYAVLVRGGVFGLGQRFHAVPWNALEVDMNRHCLVLDIEKDRLDAAPGFDDDHWPTMTDPDWAAAIDAFYALHKHRRL